MPSCALVRSQCGATWPCKHGGGQENDTHCPYNHPPPETFAALAAEGPPNCTGYVVNGRPGGENHKGSVDFWRRPKPAFTETAAKYANANPKQMEHAQAQGGAGANTPNGKSYCCGTGAPAPDCGGPDWTPVTFTFDKAGTSVGTKVSIDGTATSCKAEGVKVVGTEVSFPSLASKTDCLGQMLRATGALTGDLKASYDPTKDKLTVEVDSEGVTANLAVCK
jgi:hypothetical protein